MNRRNLVARIALTRRIRDVLHEFVDEKDRGYGIFVPDRNYETLTNGDVVEFYKSGLKHEGQASKQQNKKWFYGLDYEDKQRIKSYLVKRGWRFMERKKTGSEGK